jgi:hypothetical protein
MLSARSDLFPTNSTTPFEYPRLLNFAQINSFVENTVISCLLTIRLGWPGFVLCGHFNEPIIKAVIGQNLTFND